MTEPLSRLDPDVVALQEICDEEPLRDLQQELGETYPYYAISAFPDERGIRVAFLSKHAVDEQENIVSFPPGPALKVHDLTETGESAPVTRMGRGALRIRVTKSGLTVDLITAHLKSKLLRYPRPEGGNEFAPRDEEERAQAAGIALMRRTAEAVTLRLKANDLLRDNNRTPLILLGDFNDGPEAQTSLILSGPPEARLVRWGLTAGIWRTTFASLTLPLRSPKSDATPELTAGGENYSTRSSPPRSSSPSEKTTTGGDYQRSTATSPLSSSCPPWQTTPPSGRGRSRPTTPP